MKPEVVKVSDEATLQQIFRLRVPAWESVGLPTDVFPSGTACDEHDAHASHWAVIEGGEVLAAGRLCIHGSMQEIPSASIYEGLDFHPEAPIASLNWMVTRSDARGRGFSGLLDAARIRAAEIEGCKTVVGYCSQLSGASRLHALVEQGFRIISPMNFRTDWCPTDSVTAIAMSLPKKSDAREGSEAPSQPE